MASYKNQNSDLDIAIARLEFERMMKLEELKEQLSMTYESLKPINVIKESLEDFRHTPGTKASYIQSAISIAGGYLSKKLVMGKSHSIFKKMIGYIVQYGITSFISKKVEKEF